MVGKEREYVLSGAQREVVTTSPGRTVLLGGPGTGKTFALAERAARLIGSGSAQPGQVLVLASSRRAAEAVATLARRRLGGRPGPEAASFPAFAVALLRRHYKALGYRRLPTLLGASAQVETLRAVLSLEERSAWGRFGPALGGKVLLALAYDIANGAVENGLDEAELRRRGEVMAGAAGTPLLPLAAFLARYRGYLRRHCLVDFGEVTAGALALLSSQPAVAAEYRERYRFLLVDEGEELSWAQARLVELLVGEDNDLLLAGDPEQSVGSYRGASPSNMLGLSERLGARVVNCTEDHRSSPALDLLGAALRPGANGVANGDTAEDDSAASLRAFAYAADEARWLATEVSRLVRSGTPPEEVAIILRTSGSPLARLLKEELRRQAVPFAVPPEGGVFADPLLRATVYLLRYLAGGEGAEMALAGVLDSPLADLPPFGYESLCRAASLARCPAPAALFSDDLAGLEVPEAVVEALAALRERLAWLAAKTTWSMGSLLWEIWRTFPAFARDARAGGESSRAFAALLAEVARLEEGGRSLSLPALAERLARGDFDALGAPAIPGAGVALTTAHRAKGREWPVVFLPGLNEGNFPLRRSPMDVVAPLLLADLPVEGDSLAVGAEVSARHNAEERRIFYVAATRARQTLYLSYSHYDVDGTTALQPSRFLDALTACRAVRQVPGTEVEELPLHPAGALARYRARLRSPDPLLGLQAAYSLHRLREEFPEVVRPAEWWENVTDTVGAAPAFASGCLHLSASRLTAYRQCPLAFQFQYHWRLFEPAGGPATVGSVLHEVLEEYHRPGNGLARGRETLQRLLEERFTESAFPYRPVAKQAKRNLEEMLDLYYGRYGADGPAVAVERHFAFAFGPHSIGGYIDRVDRLPTGELEIVDYKTGQAMSKADAEADLQLGIYNLAFHEDPELAALGRPAKVSYLYLKNIGPRADGKRSYAPTEESREYLRLRVAYYAAAMLAERFPSHPEVVREFADLEPQELERVARKDPCRFCGWTWLCPRTERGNAVE